MATGNGFDEKEFKNKMEQIEKQCAWLGQSKENPQKKNRLNKTLLKHIIMLGCMKLVNLDTEFQIKMMIKISSLVKLKL